METEMEQKPSFLDNKKYNVLVFKPEVYLTISSMETFAKQLFHKYAFHVGYVGFDSIVMVWSPSSTRVYTNLTLYKFPYKTPFQTIYFMCNQMVYNTMENVLLFLEYKQKNTIKVNSMKIGKNYLDEDVYNEALHSNTDTGVSVGLHILELVKKKLDSNMFDIVWYNQSGVFLYKNNINPRDDIYERKHLEYFPKDDICITTCIHELCRNMRS